ncbi:MAG TPA: hypothetical protein VG983_07340 [Caulobacterales bacterium]|jgi:hypothetical protein|nr:hypothetical protein [Caulobacterales bacterium]
MKLIYAAAALIVATGAVIGYVTAPRGPRQEAQADQAAQEEQRATPAHFSAPRGVSLPHFSIGAKEAPDCFYYRVAYNRSLHGADSAKSKAARKQGLNAGCWMPD